MKVEGKEKREWLHNDYPASRGLSLAWLLACTKLLVSLVTIIPYHNDTLRAEVTLRAGASLLHRAGFNSF